MIRAILILLLCTSGLFAQEPGHYVTTSETFMPIISGENCFDWIGKPISFVNEYSLGNETSARSDIAIEGLPIDATGSASGGRHVASFDSGQFESYIHLPFWVTNNRFVYSSDGCSADFNGPIQLNTEYYPVGDSNLDGVFNSADLVSVFIAGKYLDHASWKDGDWNVDGMFNSNDFVFAFEQGGYSNYAIVPESSSSMFLLLLPFLLRKRI